MELFLLFTVLTALNVVVSTIKSIVTIKCGKLAAATVNALAYAINTVAIVYTVCDLPLWLKMLVVALTNFVGVFLVKLAEEKSRKDRLWKVEATFNHDDSIIRELKAWSVKHDISTKYDDITKYYEVDFYAKTKHESSLIREFIKAHNGKYFVTESKEL